MTTTAKGRYYYNADRSALVHEGDPEAAFLAVAPGDELPDGMKAPKGDPPTPEALEAAQAALDQREQEEIVARDGHGAENEALHQSQAKAAGRQADKAAAREADK